MITAMRVAQAVEENWAAATRSCLELLGPFLTKANLGLVYVTEILGSDLPEIIRLLQSESAVPNWVGVVGYSITGPLGEIYQKPSVALLTACLGEDEFCLVESMENQDDFEKQNDKWLTDQEFVTGLVYGDPRDENLTRKLARLGEWSQGFLMGGIMPAIEDMTDLAEQKDSPGLSGVLFSKDVEIITNFTQGCTPIGPIHRVTERVENIIMKLDGRPAIDFLKSESGPLIAEDLHRASGLIHVALPVKNSDRQDYMVRNLLAIDPIHGWIAIGAKPEEGDGLLFVKRDAVAAHENMCNMLSGMKKRIGDRKIKGGIYISCISRGNFISAAEGSETDMICRMLGDFPLIGVTVNGEFFHNRIYAYGGVLTLFV